MPDIREAALKAFGKYADITFNGTKISIKPAETKIDAHRDAILDIAAHRIKRTLLRSETLSKSKMTAIEA